MHGIKLDGTIGPIKKAVLDFLQTQQFDFIQINSHTSGLSILSDSLALITNLKSMAKTDPAWAEGRCMAVNGVMTLHWKSNVVLDQVSEM